MRATRHFHLSGLISLMFFGGTRDSVVSMAIRYKLNGPAFESQQGQDVFSSPITRKEASPHNVDLIAFDQLTQLLDPEILIREIFCSPKPSGRALPSTKGRYTHSMTFPCHAVPLSA